ncbi:MAG: DUF4369 domain-containing protein [Paramuribaculum sp.]|nr:DUF4369 domain-containing protein [Paramuribaculum sp.]
MKLFSHILILLAGIIAAGCSKSDSFKVSGTIEGIGSCRVELLYCVDGSYVRLGTTANDGKFTLQGTASTPAVAFLSVSGGAPLVQLIVRNGDDIQCEINPDKPFEVKLKGSKANELYANFLNSNSTVLSSADPMLINAAVKVFVEDNRKSMAATVAVITQFRAADNEIATDSLLGIISADARPASLIANYHDILVGQLATESREAVSSMTLIGRNDSIVRYTPFRHSATLMAFTGDDKASRDSILPKLRSLRNDYADKRLAVLEVNTSPDSTTWKHVTEKDSATWSQVWKPGTVAAPPFRRLSVARVPFFIVVDSVGNQQHRGSSISAAERFVREKIVKQ